MDRLDRLTDDEKIALGWKGPLIERWAAANGVPVRNLELSVLEPGDLDGLPRPGGYSDAEVLKAVDDLLCADDFIGLPGCP